MCAISGMDPPCSKCGAPALWKQQQRTYDIMAKKLAAVAEHVANLPDECPEKIALNALIQRTEE